MFKRFSFLIILLIPLCVSATPLIPGGYNIGIDAEVDGVLVVGKYKTSILEKGDVILKVNDKVVFSITSLKNAIDETSADSVKVTYVRNNKSYETYIDIYLEDGKKVTGLYVKDEITGIGTISYINPLDKTYGALGHEIALDKVAPSIRDGVITDSSVKGIKKSTVGSPGYKISDLGNNVMGNIYKNSKCGIFGNYKGEINLKTYETKDLDEVSLGDARMLTVVDGKTVKEYDIKILKVDKSDLNKNIVFEITDSELLSKTGGVIQGMSGSTIMQGDYIIGAVNFVIVNNPKVGYAIGIENMLKEAKLD